MNVEDIYYIFSGVWGSGAAISVMGAFLVFFLKRSLTKYDRHIERQYAEIARIKAKELERFDISKDAINDVKLQLGIIETQVESLSKLIDRINLNGCRNHRN